LLVRFHCLCHVLNKHWVHLTKLRSYIPHQVYWGHPDSA
jgi:hypothetical protein